jgi:glycosyltransferase involved in cell wall biosynthesis
LAAVPVVTYDIDGNREGVLNEKSGFVIPPFDKVRLTRALVGLLGDEGMRRRMGEAGRAFALGRFDARVMVEALERVYADARAAGRTREDFA